MSLQGEIKLIIVRGYQFRKPSCKHFGSMMASKLWRSGGVLEYCTQLSSFEEETSKKKPDNNESYG